MIIITWFHDAHDQIIVVQTFLIKRSFFETMILQTIRDLLHILYCGFISAKKLWRTFACIGKYMTWPQKMSTRQTIDDKHHVKLKWYVIQCSWYTENQFYYSQWTCHPHQFFYYWHFLSNQKLLNYLLLLTICINSFISVMELFDKLIIDYK